MAIIVISINNVKTLCKDSSEDPRRATRNISERGLFVKLGHSDKYFVKNSRKKVPAGKNFEVSSTRHS